MSSNVFNSTIGTPFDFGYPTYTKQQEDEILAGFFEQLMIFDKVTICTDRLNFSLFLLIKRLGINTVEQLIDRGYIQFMLWTPLIVMSTGMSRDDGSIDESAVLGKPPLVAGSLSEEDINPELNVERALQRFNLHRDRKRSFTRKAEKNYIIPGDMKDSALSTQIITDAYKNNNLESLGLPFAKEPDQLTVAERSILQKLGHNVLETSILSKYELKSFEQYEPFAICKRNMENIGKAYNVAGNNSGIFTLENLPKLKELYLTERLEFDSVFVLRNLATARYYRKWINGIGESNNLQEVTKDYLNQVKGNGRFFDTVGGKLTKNLTMLGANAAIGTAVAGPAGTVAGAVLGLLETFWIDGMLKGKNPSMFIEGIRQEAFPAREETYVEKK
jgi:hypothetical protein